MKIYLYNQQIQNKRQSNHQSLSYGFFYFILLHSKCICRQKSVYEKRLKMMFNGSNYDQKSAVLWDKNRNVKSAWMRNSRNFIWSILWKIFIVFLDFLYFFFNQNEHVSDIEKPHSNIIIIHNQTKLLLWIAHCLFLHWGSLLITLTVPLRKIKFCNG